MKPSNLNVLAIVPSGYCFGLQYVTLDFFNEFSGNISSHFLITKWSDGIFERELQKRKLPYTKSWLGMFSRKLDWVNIKMSIECLAKLPILYWDFYKLRRKFKPDVLYFANHHELILLFPILLLNKRIPVVCHMHDPSPAINFQKKTFKFYSSVVKRFIAISENVRQRTIQLGAIPAKVVTIHNGVYLPQNFNKERIPLFTNKFNLDTDSILIGITGQISRTKGHEDLIRAIGLCVVKNPRIKLIIGGKKTGEFILELETLIRDLNLKGVVLFSDWIEDPNLFYRSIDIYILASRHDEGYGLVVAEAMANFKPVIATNSGGVVEIIENNNTGYIVDKNSVIQLSEKILELSEDIQRRKEMGEKGRNRIINYFSLPDQTRKLEELLFEITFSEK